MKASDVTIGDWVYDTHSYNYNKEKEPVKLDRNEFVELICGCTGNNDLDLGDMYEPVPLTEEILKANGWTKQHMEYEEYIWRCPEECIYLTQYNTNGQIYLEETDIELNYAHQLQHALRLCGLDELADNFKL